MRLPIVFPLAACLGLAGIPVAAEQWGRVPGQIFTVAVSGPSVVEGARDVKLSGIAFAISPDRLLSAPLAVASDADFRADPQFGAGGVPLRVIALRDMAGPAAAEAAVQFSGRAVLLAGAGAEPMALSACALEDADHAIPLPGAGEMIVRPVRRLQIVTHFEVRQQMDGWSQARAMLGAPVLRGRQVVGVLTDAAADGLTLQVTPIAEIIDMIPPDVPVECDPRVHIRDLRKLQAETRQLALRVSEMGRKLDIQTDRAQLTQEMLRITISALADVAGDLTQLQLVNNNIRGDIQPILNRMADTLKPSEPLLKTVAEIESYLQRPAWRSFAKMDGDKLHLTFSYRTQMPGPPYSEQLKLCLRLVKPYAPSEPADHNFRSPGFYAAASQPDEAALVWCDWEAIANPGPLTDQGSYIFETYRDDLNYMFQVYQAQHDWIPESYAWSGLSYATLVRPAAEGATQPAGDSIILRALILARDDPERAAPRAVECMLFDSDQDVIDFLANRAPPAGTGAFDDVTGLTLDPENASDECVSPLSP